MDQSVFMQLEMDAALRARFQDAAAREQRPVAKVLRQLMREYVARQSEPGAVRSAVGVDAARYAMCGVGASPAGGDLAEEAPAFVPNDRDMEEMERRQQGWRCCPFGMG